MIESYEADDYITYNAATFTEDTDIFDAIHVLLQRKTSGGTVVDENKKVVGVISELDCLKAIINSAYYREGGGKVKDFMTTGDIEYMSPHLGLVDAAQKILSTGHRRMPVVENGKFIGQISARSVLQAFKDSLSEHDASEDDIYV